MDRQPIPESVTTFPANKQSQFASECWFDDACILDMDYFIKTLSVIKSKGVRPDLIGSIIIHYASKWLPDLSLDSTEKPDSTNFKESPESVTTSWMRKRFFVETLVGVLPPEKDSVPCNFLLHLLRTANMVGVEPTYREEIEKRISWQLDQASLKEIMIPSFSHACGTLLDIELVIRLVKRFVMNMEEGVIRSGAALIKVAKLVDCYLAEAAVDSGLGFEQFLELGRAIPGHARATDDGLYRAIDTYLKAHPNAAKEERKTLCGLMDSRKLSSEAAIHAAQNNRLPVRAVIQVLFSEQSKLNGHSIAYSGLFSSNGSPNSELDHPARCHSKREITAQHMEIKRLKEDVLRLQIQCNSMHMLMERILMEEKRKGFFKWMKFGLPSFKSGSVTERNEDGYEGEVGFGRQTPMDIKTDMKGKTPMNKPWKKSMS